MYTSIYTDLQIEDPIRLFEPFLTEFEKGVLIHHGCELITKNEVG